MTSSAWSARQQQKERAGTAAAGYRIERTFSVWMDAVCGVRCAVLLLSLAFVLLDCSLCCISLHTIEAPVQRNARVCWVAVVCGCGCGTKVGVRTACCMRHRTLQNTTRCGSKANAAPQIHHTPQRPEDDEEDKAVTREPLPSLPRPFVQEVQLQLERHGDAHSLLALRSTTYG